MNEYHQRCTRVIHWGMATLVIAMLGLGFIMAYWALYGVYALHKSFGLVALFAILLRFYWRRRQPWISSTRGTSLEKFAQRAHLGLLLLVLLMPLTGLLLSGFGGYGVELFGLELIPMNMNADGEIIPFNAALSDFGYAAHEVIAYVLTALLLGHILAALKHHFVDKDNTLKRMLGRQ